MYTFDADKLSAMKTYDEVCEIYTNLFKFIGVPFVKGTFLSEKYKKKIIGVILYKMVCINQINAIQFIPVEADAKDMGGYLSHEYHYLAPIGDENVKICRSCLHSIKSNDEKTVTDRCSVCNGTNLEENKGIEVESFFHLTETLASKN